MRDGLEKSGPARYVRYTLRLVSALTNVTAVRRVASIARTFSDCAAGGSGIMGGAPARKRLVMGKPNGPDPCRAARGMCYDGEIAPQTLMARAFFAR